MVPQNEQLAAFSYTCRPWRGLCACVLCTGVSCAITAAGADLGGVTTVTSMGSRNHALDGARPGPSTGRGTVGRHVPLNNKRVQLMSWHCV